MSDGIHHFRNKQTTIHESAIYRHFKGGLYVVLAIADPSGDIFRKQVTYMCLETGNRYWRWYDGEDGFTTPKVQEDGKLQTRFEFHGWATMTINDRGISVTQRY